MKKIISILALLIMVTLLASCGGNKEWSKAEEANEGAKVEAAEQATPTNAAPEAPVAAPEAPVAAPEAPVAAPVK